jgi:hypothetical protein
MIVCSAALSAFPEFMSKQYKKVIKRRRRKDYLARQKLRQRELVKARK